MQDGSSNLDPREHSPEGLAQTLESFVKCQFGERAASVILLKL
jgi:hypothetical protein